MKYTAEQKLKIQNKPIEKDGFLIFESKINLKFGKKIKSKFYNKSFFDRLLNKNP
jgi:hypothetical protein